MSAPTKTKVIITSLVSVFIFGFLFWEHFHDGVASHHLLDQKELPAISNWWSGIFLPVLTWFLLGRIEKRLNKQSSQSQKMDRRYWEVLGLFFIGLSLAICLAVSFTNNYSFFLDNVIYLFLILSLLVPIYYAEFILGFILGMTYTFGAILPTVFVLILAALGFVIYKFIRSIIIKMSKILLVGTPKNTNP